MRRIGFVACAVIIAFVLVTVNNTIFANSCCGVKEKEVKKECNIEDAKGSIKGVSTGESFGDVCPVCGKASDSEGQQVDVKHGGKTAHLCCEGCANEYNANPDKYSKSEHPSQSHREEHPKSEHPKKEKEHGAEYY